MDLHPGRAAYLVGLLQVPRVAQSGLPPVHLASLWAPVRAWTDIITEDQDETCSFPQGQGLLSSGPEKDTKFPCSPEQSFGEKAKPFPTLLCAHCVPSSTFQFSEVKLDCDPWLPLLSEFPAFLLKKMVMMKAMFSNFFFRHFKKEGRLQLKWEKFTWTLEQVWKSRTRMSVSAFVKGRVTVL